MNRYSYILLVWFVVLVIPLVCQAATFTPLGDFPEGAFGSGAGGISGDGTTVVGFGTVLDPLSKLGPLLGEAAQWTTSGDITALRDDVSFDGFDRVAIAASQNGNVIIGSKNGIFVPQTQEAFRWTAADGIVGLGFLPGDFRSTAEDISGSGETIVGSSINITGSNRAYRWTSATGMVSLGTLPTDASRLATSGAGAISADGSIIVGYSTSGLSNEAFRWTEETGMVSLGVLPGGLGGSIAEGISTDGFTIVGSASSELSQFNREAFRWTEQTGMQGLGFLNATDFRSTAEFTSYDGQLVFGFAFDFDSFQYFVWDPINGMRDFVQVLGDEFGLGGDLAGWTDFVPRDISDDGLSLVGAGINPDGNREAWLIQLDHPIGVPEPTTLALLACGMLVFPSFFKRIRQGT